MENIPFPTAPRRTIDLTLPRSWNECTTEQLETIARITRDRVIHADRYNHFDPFEIKVALFFLLADLQIVRGIDPTLSADKQYYTVIRRGVENDAPFPIYLWQIHYWLTRDTDPRTGKLLNYGILDWMDSDTPGGLFVFPYPTLSRRGTGFLRRLLPKQFSGPDVLMQNFSWAQFRYARDYMTMYVERSNALYQSLEQMGYTQNTTSIDISNHDDKVKLMHMEQGVADARAKFLATIFTPTSRVKDHDTGMTTRSARFVSSQAETNDSYFRGISDTQWQVIMFWWSGCMAYLAKEYPHIFTSAKPKKEDRRKPPRVSNPLSLYNSIIASMHTKANLTERETNDQTYTVILEQLERIARENEANEKALNGHK